MYAVIRTGGKQYRVAPGDVIRVESQGTGEDRTIEFSDVLAMSGSTGQIGRASSDARGSHADVTIFDPKKRWTFEAEKSRSKSRNTPFDGWQLTGKVVATVVGGRVVYRAE